MVETPAERREAVAVAARPQARAAGGLCIGREAAGRSGFRHRLAGLERPGRHRLSGWLAAGEDGADGCGGPEERAAGDRGAACLAGLQATSALDTVVAATVQGMAVGGSGRQLEGQKAVELQEVSARQ